MSERECAKNFNLLSFISMCNNMNIEYKGKIHIFIHNIWIAYDSKMRKMEDKWWQWHKAESIHKYILCIVWHSIKMVSPYCAFNCVGSASFQGIHYFSQFEESSLRWNLVSTINSANMRIFLCIDLLMNQYAHSVIWWPSKAPKRKSKWKIWKVEKKNGKFGKAVLSAQHV